jgi:(p)ppGpp synthase/HD superfamily hydrolase
MNIIYKARLFATAAHDAVGQQRKYTGEPYINHPAEVVDIIERNAIHFTDRQLAAAWLHDVVEDTGVSLELIAQEFGGYVAKLVEHLTDVSKPEDGNRAARKAIDLEHTAKCCPAAATIKVADLISNSRSIMERDPEFAKVYIPEKLKTLEVLKNKADPALYEMALAVCNGAIK